MARSSRARSIQALDRAASIIALACQKGRISANDVSKELDLERTTAYRYLMSLTDNGFLARSPIGDASSYELGRLARVISAALLAGDDVVMAAKNQLQGIADATGYTTVLGVRAHDKVTVVDVAYPAGATLSVRLPVGYVVAPDGVQSIVTLSYDDEPARERALLALPEPRRSVVRELIPQVRQDGGLAMTAEGSVMIAAAPILKAGRAAATVATLSHINGSTAGDTLDDLIAIARQLSSPRHEAGTG